MARDPALRERLVAGGRAVVDAYGWDTAAAVHEDAYRAFQGDPIGARLMGASVHVEARQTGPLSAVVTAREHELIADEPLDAGGERRAA